MMRRFFGTIWSSSQPTIKQEVVESESPGAREEHEDETVENGEEVIMGKQKRESFKGLNKENGEGGGDGEEIPGKTKVKANSRKKGKGKGKSKARKSKGKKVEELEEQEQEPGVQEKLGDKNNDQEIPAETVNGGHDEEIPAVEQSAEAVNMGPYGNFDDEEYTLPVPKSKRLSLEEKLDDEEFEPAPKSKRVRKSNGATKKRKQSVMEEAEEEAGVVTEEKSAKKKGRSTRSRKSRKGVVEEDTQDAVTQGGEESTQQHEADLAELPRKVERAKKKARVSPHKAFEDIVAAAEEDDNDSAAALHRPLTPAHMSHDRNGSNIQEDNLEATAQLQKDAQSSVSADPEGEPDTTSKKPSKKALGKRKASEVGLGANKKRKTQQEKPVGTPELAVFGFFTQSSESSSRAILPPSQRRATPAFTPINGPKPAILPPSVQRPPPEPEFDEDSDEPEYVPSPEVPKSSEHKKKRRLPVDDEPSKANPTTPQKRSGKSKTPNSKTKTPNPRPTTAKGRLSNEEIEAISAAVEEYREQNELTQVEINDLVQKDAKTDGLQLWKYVYDEIPDIPHTKVLNLCRRKFHNFEARGSWTEEQDQELREAYEKYPGKWKQIGESMNRFSEDCRDRWRNYLVCGDNLRKDVWDKEEEERLKEVVQECIELVREMMQVSDDPRAANASAESLVDWNVVSQKMDRSRSRLQCLNKWKKLKDREEVIVEDPVVAEPISETWRIEEAERDARKMKAKEKLQLLYAIRESGAGREGKIPWRLVKEELPGKARKMALRVCFRQMRQQIEDNEDMKLQDIVDLLIDAFEAAAPAEPTGFDDFEGFRSSQRRLSRKKKRKSSGEADISDDNGEGPSTITKRKRRSRLSEKYVLEKDDTEDNVWAMPQDEPPKSNRRKIVSSLRADDNVDSPGTTKKRKLHERMKDVGQSQSQSQSQETERRPSELSDVRTALESLKTGTSKARRAAAEEAAKALIAERVVESDEEEAHVVEEELPSKARRVAPKKARKALNAKLFVDSDELEPLASHQEPLVNARRAAAKKGAKVLSAERVVESEEEEAPEEVASASEEEQASNGNEPPVYEEKLSSYDEELRASGEETSSNEDQPPLNGEESSSNEEHEATEDAMDLDELENYNGAGNSEAEEELMDLDNPEAYTAAGGPEPEDDVSSYEDEQESLQNHDQESIDLDQDRSITTNGAHENENEASDFHDIGSVDLDTPVQTDYEPLGKSKKSASPVSFEEEPPKLNGFTNGHHMEEERVSSDDDDMSDIPAKVPAKFVSKVVQPKKKRKTKTKAKKRALGF